MLKKIAHVLFVVCPFVAQAQDTHVCIDDKGRKTVQNWKCGDSAPSPVQETARLEKIKKDLYPNLVACGMAQNKASHCVEQFKKQQQQLK